jgi:hypothetical protein
MTEFAIKSGVPIPDTRGRKPGSKDSRKFANRGRPPKRGAVQRAVDMVRNEQCSIDEATHRFFDEYIESKRTTTKDERKNDGRLNEFQLKIVEELKRNLLDWKARKALAELHSKKAAKYPRYKKKVRENQKNRLAFIAAEINSIPAVKIENELKSVESDE